MKQVQLSAPGISDKKKDSSKSSGAESHQERKGNILVLICLGLEGG